MKSLEQLPVAVIGAGPVGLATAAHLHARKLPFVVLEASDDVAATFRSTAHVRLFSPWKMNIEGASARLLEPTGWRAPEPDGMPTAGELCTHYLEPLAKALSPHVQLGSRVELISRRRFDKVKTSGREHAPFVLRVRHKGQEQVLEARAVIDASGTWQNPNWMGADGLPALAEREHSARITYGMPNILHAAGRARYANKRVLVVGAGHSALGSLIALAELAEQATHTRIVWAIRGDSLERILGGGDKDGLPARGSLGLTLRGLLTRGRFELYRAFHIEAVHESDGRLTVTGVDRAGDPQSIAGLDEIIAATGARPDLSLARELRLRMDPLLESTEQLAPLIDPNVHSCGSVPPHGHRELAHPEPGYYAVGAKSYGRAPNFLLATGYEQVRSVVAALAGAMADADDVQLVLPETGVCSTDLGTDSGGGCCAVEPEEPAPRCAAAPDVAPTPKTKSTCCA